MNNSIVIGLASALFGLLLMGGIIPLAISGSTIATTTTSITTGTPIGASFFINGVVLTQAQAICACAALSSGNNQLQITVNNALPASTTTTWAFQWCVSPMIGPGQCLNLSPSAGNPYLFGPVSYNAPGAGTYTFTVTISTPGQSWVILGPPQVQGGTSLTSTIIGIPFVLAGIFLVARGTKKGAD